MLSFNASVLLKSKERIPGKNIATNFEMKRECQSYASLGVNLKRCSSFGFVA